MKKELCGLLLGAALLTFPLKGVGQEPNKNNHEYNLLWKGFSIGKSNCNSDTVSFSLGDIHDLNFYKTDRSYQEISNFRGSEETYFYVKEKDSWKFKEYFYPLDKKSEKRQNKINLKGKIYSPEVIVGSEIFSELEKKVIPDTLKLVVFGEVYTFGKKNVKYGLEKIFGKEIKKEERKNFVEVNYNLPYFPKHETDKVRLNELVKVYLKKREDGTHSIVGGKANIQYKLGWWFNFELDVVEKSLVE